MFLIHLYGWLLSLFTKLPTALIGHLRKSMCYMNNPLAVSILERTIHVLVLLLKFDPWFVVIAEMMKIGSGHSMHWEVKLDFDSPSFVIRRSS